MPDDPHTAAPDHDVEGYVDAHRESFVDDLITWCKIPSISSSPDHTKEVRLCAEHLRDHLAQRGATSTAILETTGHPAVFAEGLVSPDKPTLLIYGHHDVQPIDPLPAWHSPPFEPTIRDGRLWGRGVVDYKGQVDIHAKAIET